jgi:hypothetical protein
MNFIEQWFGLSPDGGNGMFEAGIVLAILLVGSAVFFRGRIRTVLHHEVRKFASVK